MKKLLSFFMMLLLVTMSVSAQNSQTVSSSLEAVSNTPRHALRLERQMPDRIPQASVLSQTRAGNTLLAEGLADINSVRGTTASGTELSIVMPRFYSMIPVSQANFPLSATVINNGNAVAANDNVAVDFTVTPGSFNEIVTHTTGIPSAGSVSMTTTTNFTTAALDAYTWIVSTDYQDDNLTNNSAQLLFSTTMNTYARDNGTVVGGVGNNTGPITFGNVFDIFVTDTLKAVSLIFPNVTATESYRLAVYSVVGNTATQMFMSGDLIRTPDMGNMVTEVDIPDQVLQPGKYLVAVCQLGSANIGLGYDQAPNGSFYTINSTGVISEEVRFGNVMLRLKTSTSPALLSAMIETGQTEIALDRLAENADFYKTMYVSGFNLTTGITATTAAPFEISTDATNFSTTATLPATGGALHVRYTSTSTSSDQGTVTFTATGANTVTVNLTGNSIDCDAQNLPILEDFEGMGADCWQITSANNDNDLGIFILDGAHSGTNIFVFSSMGYSLDYSQYLISPKIPETTGNIGIEFYYVTSYGSENFRIGYSTTDNELASFTWKDEQTVDSYDWTQFTDEIPQGAKYFAIKYTSEYLYDLFIDDVKISGEQFVEEDVTITAYAPANAATDIVRDAVVSVTFSDDIAVLDLSGVTITPDPGSVSATAAGNQITIAHDDFDYETTYTVTIPAGALDNYDETITWSFTTLEEENAITGFDNMNIKVYPNPTTGKLKMESGELGIEDIEIFDVYGRNLFSPIRQLENSSTNIDLSDLPAGIYFLRIVTEKGSVVQKVVKN